ncbi:hypothetical protein CC80DRAFT_549898 [Byssothecium circinans]|uniref:Uncharacterized protein n=1 Tax=Byssothecium circinans TaxID=147558 RepID=A0A6A5U0J9_9PLEO|nr:hypothetical protein CC80DRAFT_549898 [Byssothecium circinans]
MDPNSYTPIAASAFTAPPYLDPLNEYENHDTIYTLLIHIPPRPPPRYIPSFLTRTPVVASHHHVIKPNPLQSDPQTYDMFELRDLPDMKTKTVKIKAYQFTLGMRCEHVYGGNNKVCQEGCYVLEKGGEVARWCCKRDDCEGHVFVGKVKKNEEGVACFGKKGERMLADFYYYLPQSFAPRRTLSFIIASPSHERETSDMTTVHHSPPPGATPFAIYEDPEDHEPPSPSDVYEGDVSFNSEMSLPGVDEAIPSIEHDDEAQDQPQRYSASYTSRPSILSSSPSRRVSGITTTSFVSSLPSEISVASKPILPANNLDSRYSPRKERPTFRNPASVRAMQMASPPPLPAIEASRERLKGNYKLATPSKSGRSDSMSTTGSRRHRSHRESLHRDNQARESPHPTPTPQQFPLVLLHVTILPMQMPCSHDMMVKVMPEWLVENYRVLEEKLQDIILMRRGLLIPHPRDEYEVLEERILESLELKVPRLLKCGHFIGPEDEDEDEDNEHLNDDDRGSVVDDGTGRGSRMSGGTITVEEEVHSEDESLCTDCHRQVKKPGKGVGAGTKRWDIKIYAANGLMRAGAWLAAWAEMERCDVEITPWIPEDVRKALDKRLIEEEAAQRKKMYAEELQRQIQEEAVKQKQAEEEAEIKQRAAEIQLQSRMEEETAALHQKLEQEAVEKRRLEETLYEKIEEAKETMRLEFEAQAMAEANSVAERLRAMEDILRKQQEKAAAEAPPVFDDPSTERKTHSRSRRRARSVSRQPKATEVPLSTLLKNYLLILMQSSSNLILVILSVLVVYLVMNMDNQNLPILSAGPFVDQVSDAVPSVVITSTATMTTTSVSTLTVTALPSVESVYELVETIVPSLGISGEFSQASAPESTPTPSASVEISSETIEASSTPTILATSVAQPSETPSEVAAASLSEDTPTVSADTSSGTVDPSSSSEEVKRSETAAALLTPDLSDEPDMLVTPIEPEDTSPESASPDMSSPQDEPVQELDTPSSGDDPAVRDEL